MNEKQELPQGWAWVAIGELSTSKNGIVDGPFGSNLKTSDYIDDIDNGVPVLTTKNLEGDYSPERVRFVSISKFEELKRSQVNGGDILIAKIGSIGKSGVYPKGYPTALIPANLIKITLDNEEFFKYIYHHIKSRRFQDLIKSISKATAQPAFNVSQFRRLSVPLPPLPEQRRIVAKLEELFSRLDAGVAAVRRTQVLLKRYRQSVLHAAVTGELTRAWREAHPAPTETGAALLRRIRAERRAQWEAAQVARRGGQLPLGDGWKSKYVEPEKPNTSELPELPVGWAWVSVEELATDTLIGLVRSALEQNTFGDGVPYIKMNNIDFGGRIDTSELVSVKASEEEVARYALRDGDILFNTRNSVELVGKTGLFHQGVEAVVFNNNLMRLRLISDIRPAYMVNAICSPDVRKRLDVIKRATTSIAAIYAKDFLPFAIPLPPLPEQAEIVAEVERRLTVLDTLSQTLTDELKRAERLRQSILHRAFTGRLVPQVATDEPAAALLARLRETPAAPAKTKAGRGHKAVAQQTTLGL